MSRNIVKNLQFFVEFHYLERKQLLKIKLLPIIFTGIIDNMISIRGIIALVCILSSILSFAAVPKGGANILESNKEIMLPQGKNVNHTDIPFSACPEKKMEAVYLYFNARMTPTSGSGWVHSLGLKVNGKRVESLTKSGKVRLLNRIGQLQTSYAGGKGFNWWLDKKNGKILLLFYGAKDNVDARVIYPREEGTGYLLDITDLVNSDKKNTVTFINYLSSIYKDNIERAIAIDDLQIGYINNKVLARMRRESSEKQETIRLNYLSQPPKIDGIIKKQEWDKAYRTRLQNIRIGELKNPSEIYIGYDNENLYFAFQLFEKNMDKLKTAFNHAEEHDNAIWQDDCVEIFLAPYGNDKDFYQIIINAAGITYDAFAGRTVWESFLRKSVRKNKDSWTVEAAIPLHSLNIDIQAGDIWGINVGREEKNSAELSAINPTPGSFSKNVIPAQFGAPKNGISLTALNFKKSSKLKIIIENSTSREKDYDIKLNVTDDKGKITAIDKKISIKAKSKDDIEIPYPQIRIPKHIELFVADKEGTKLYYNKIEIPINIVAPRVWKVKNPLYEELLPEKHSAPVRAFIWRHNFLHADQLIKQGLQYGFPYSRTKKLSDDKRNKLIHIGLPSSKENIDRLILPYYRYANAPKIENKPFLFDPVVKSYYLQSVKKIIAASKTEPIWGIAMGDETAEIAIDRGIKFLKKMRNKYKYIQKLDSEIKNKYGGGKWGMPHSLNDQNPGRWIAYHQFISTNLANLMHTVYKIIKEQAPELKLVTYDPVDLSNAYDYALWRGSFDIATMQLYPRSRDFSTEFAHGVKKIRDLSGAKDVRPVPHVEHYANNYTLEETLELLSQAVRGGANGWHFFIGDTIGFRSGIKYLTSETFGAPERALLLMTVAQNTPKLKYPESDSALFSSNITNWSGHDLRSEIEGVGFTMLGPNAGVWFDFINETIMEEMPNKLKKYKVIFVCDAEYETQAAVKALKNYVEKGGALVVFDPKAFTKNRYAEDAMAIQRDLLGFAVGKSLKRTNFISNGISYEVNSPIYEIKPGSDCQVLATFADKNPALIERKIGKGKIHFFAFNPCSLKSAKSEKWRKYFHQYAQNLGLKTDHKIWRFAFPQTLIKKLPEPQGRCLTNNNILWRLFTPIGNYNHDSNGTYSYSRIPDKIIDYGGIKDIPFSKGDLTNRRKAPTAGNVDLGSGKMETWVVAFYTNNEMSIDFDLKKTYPVNRVELFYQGLLPSMEVLFSEDGEKWYSIKESSELENKEFKSDVKQKIIFLKDNLKSRFIKVKFNKSESKQLLTLSEIEIWTK